MSQPTETPAVACHDLWFSYEVAQSISSTAKTIDIDAAKEAKSLRDGGLSVENPRKQHDSGTEIVYKLQLSGVTCALPVGARCMLVGANGGKHMVNESSVRVLGRAAFEDTTLSSELALL